MKAEREKQVIDKQARIDKTLETVRRLPAQELEKLKKRAITMIKRESPGNEYALRDSLVEIKMSSLYIADHETESDSDKD